MLQYAMYLRKSRADLDAEARGEGETLARHRRALTELANKRGLYVAHVYEEIVSGDSIEARPQMQALLAAVERGEYAGVIVNDIDRLARGDSFDQAIIRQTFAGTNTVIITPYKDYDLRNVTDDDQLDFKLFMARFEYKAITRRMQTGRMRSAAEGNYIGTRVPYGYRRIKRPDRAGYTLEPDPDTAPAVRSMFRWYATESVGAQIIADRLNAQGYKTTFGHTFTPDGVRSMLKNPNYIGQVSWAKHIKSTRFVDGQRVELREKNAAPIVVENAHPAIVDRDTWDAVRLRMAGHRPMPKNKMARVSNVLAGLVRCAHCGHTMQRKPGIGGRPDAIYCTTLGCPTTSIYIPTLEGAILDTVKGWAIQYTSPTVSTLPTEAPNTRAIDKQLATIDKQLASLQDLLEQGIYSPQEYIQRRDHLRERKLAATLQREAITNAPSDADLIRANLPQIQHVLDAYPKSNDLESKNALLKSIIRFVNYDKTHHCYRNENPSDHLTITIYPCKDIF